MRYTEVKLPYASSFITAKIPEKNLSYVLSTKEEKGLLDEGAAITESMRNPIGAEPLVKQLKKTDKIIVISTDYTRPCPDDRILPPVLKELEKVVPRTNITVMVALGLHPPQDKAGLTKKLGKYVMDNYSVIQHDVKDTVNLGKTSRGTPIDINRRVVEADFRVSVGFIEPHLFAGFSGGRKSIAPGVFSASSAYRNHGYNMIDSPNARPGVLKGNPIHEDMVEIARAAKLDFIVNVLMNKKREITHVVAGDMVKAHEAGCKIAAKVNGVRVPHKVDIAIATNSGAPLDLDFYQTAKGIETAYRITRDGGIIIAVSACFEGVGAPSYHKVHAACRSPKEVLRELMVAKPEGVPWENQILARIQLKNDIYLVSELEPDVVKDFMVTPVKTVEDGLRKASRVMGADAQVAVIPEGPMVIPLVGD